MVTGQQCIALIILSLFVGMLVGAVIWYWSGYPKCEHKWEEIINTCGKGGCGKVVVHMCMKCGKKKVTKV